MNNELLFHVVTRTVLPQNDSLKAQMSGLYKIPTLYSCDLPTDLSRYKSSIHRYSGLLLFQVAVQYTTWPFLKKVCAAQLSVVSTNDVNVSTICL